MNEDKCNKHECNSIKKLPCHIVRPQFAYEVFLKGKGEVWNYLLLFTVHIDPLYQRHTVIFAIVGFVSV